MNVTEKSRKMTRVPLKHITFGSSSFLSYKIREPKKQLERILHRKKKNKVKTIQITEKDK